MASSRPSGRSSSSNNNKRSRLVSELMSHRMDDDDDGCEEEGGDRFFIRSHNEGFQSRQTSVFDKLNELENKFSVNSSAWKDYEAPAKDEEEEEVLNGEGPSVPNAPTPPEQFKIPIGVAPKRAPSRASHSSLTEAGSSVPAYSANPDQWTKYSLANITAEFMSEDANTDAAMTFLTSRWKSCSDYEEGGGGGEGSGSDAVQQPPRKLEFGKFLMPEYSVGRPGAKKTASSGSSKSSNATKSSTSKESESPLDAAATTEKAVKANDDLPKVKLSFLNAVADQKVVGSGSSKMEEEEEETAVDDARSDVSDTEPVFRAVRKRKRNIRQASVNHDDGENVEGAAD